MQSRDYFPLGIAAGFAFCNRTQETAVLVENMKHGKHTLLMATRRYGKSSLALHALQLSGQAYVELDFYMATSEKVIESYLLNGVVELIGKALGPVDKLLVSIKKYIKNLKPKIDIGATVFKLELSVDSESDPATNIKEALLLLEKLLEEKKTHAVMLLDEFQSVGILAQGKGIEGAIRHVAQKTRYLTFIFSGSSRRLLKTMFEDASRPLYKLCWKIEFHRITAQHYQAHLKKAAQLAWKKHLDELVCDEIIRLTERHPFYFNKLCDRIWVYFQNKPPCINDVQEAWFAILAEEKSDAVKEISLLSLGQKSVLGYIAQGPMPFLTGKQAVLELQMMSSSIVTALEGLEEKDVIEKESDHYHIINPVIAFYAAKQ